MEASDEIGLHDFDVFSFIGVVLKVEEIKYPENKIYNRNNKLSDKITIEIKLLLLLFLVYSYILKLP